MGGAPVAALAASLLLAVGLGTVWSDWRFTQRLEAIEARGQAERLLLAKVLQDGLESHKSGEPLTMVAGEIGFGATVMPVRTYKSKSGHWCREFTEMIRRDGEEYRSRGLACRLDGGWQRVETTIEGEEVEKRL
jgi:hypothetical protein